MKYLLSLSVLLFTFGCSNSSTNGDKTADKSYSKTETMEKYADDVHSYAEPNKVAVTHLDLDIEVDMKNHIVKGSASYDLERTSGDTLILDIRDLEIKKVVEMPGEAPLNYKIREGWEFGDALLIALNDSTKRVKITYETSPEAAALLWMAPEQTLGKTAPFMFSQGEAILTRSWIPIQDTPAIRLTYTARVKVPEGLMVVMSAENPTEVDPDGVYTFKMEQPIAPYLMAIAVGDLEYQSLGERSGVYAEPAMIDRAAYEFADVEKMIAAAEELYGPYRWGQYDLLILPPSFPFGGMENPRLTFVTPTVIVGDRSLTALVAHELAHSWSGNLVTNATWADFWLNEGFTVYFERRIMESIYGSDYADMLAELGFQDLKNTLDDLGWDSPDTRLHLDLKGRNPDDGMTDIAYEKGYLFLKWLEQKVGREKFDAFLREYFDSHAFETMTTEAFVSYLDSTLLKGMDPRPDVEAWIYSPGLPEGYPTVDSKLFNAVDTILANWTDGSINTSEIPSDSWTTHEWLHFLRGLPDSIGIQKMADLDKRYDLTNSKNSEIADEWYLLAIKNDYQVAFPAMAQFLKRVGRRKFLTPLYTELAKTDAHKKWALDVYEEARENYHIIAVRTIDEVLGWQKEAVES